MPGDPNLLEPDWDGEMPAPPFRQRAMRVGNRAGSHDLGATLYELDPGDFLVYHFHHAWEELLIVLRGRPTLRTPEGERQLAEGDVVHFASGPEGAHGIRNDTDDLVRYVVAGTRVSPEIVEYPDLNQVTGQSRHGIFFIHDVDASSTTDE